MAENNGDNSASTILVAVVIVLLIGLAFYFGVMKDGINDGGNGGGVNVELNTPDMGGAEAQ